MRKRISLLLAVALSSVITVKAQDQQDMNFLNHLSIGATAGTDAVGIQAAIPLTDHFIVRAAYVSGFNLAYERSFPVDMDAKWDNNDFSIHQDMAFKASLKPEDLRVMLDIYPFKRAGFHLTAGVYYGLRSTRYLQVENLTPLPIEPDEYGRVGISVNGQFITTDENGCVNVGINIPKIRPYAGIGFGRPVSPRSRVSMTLDLGACYWNEPTLQATDYEGEPVIITSESVQNLDEGWIDTILGYAKVLPIVQLGLHVRLF